MKTFLVYWKKYSFLLFFIFLPIVAIVDLRFGLLALLCILSPIIISFFNGRYWCGNLCPRGSLFDIVGKPFSNHKKTPELFQNIFFRVLIIVITFGYFGYSIYISNFDLYKLGLVFCKFIVITTLIAFSLATFYNERTWCNLCPIGTLSMLNSKKFNSDKKMFKIKNICTECKVCETICPSNISITNYKGKINTNTDCLKCGKCIEICPTNSINK